MTTWAKGCDFSYDKPDLQTLWDAGYRVILGYLSNTPGKGLTAAYIAEALAIGFRVVPLYETTARAALGGRATGIAQATAAMRIGAALGMPSGTTVIFALDSDFTTAEMATVAQFVEGLHSIVGSDGEYGGIDQLRYLLAHSTGDAGRLFQTYAWSNGQWLAVGDAPIQQFHNGLSIAGGTVDDCRVDLDSTSIHFWGGDPMSDTDTTKATFQTDGVLKNYAWRPDATSNPTITAESLIREGGDEAHAAHIGVVQANATLAAIVKTEAALQLTLNTIAAAVTSGVPVDTAALAADIKAVGAAESAAVTALNAQVTALLAQVAQLKSALGAAAAAETAALAK